MRYTIHVDMDAFFASVEQRGNPHLRGKPVIVGGKPGTRSAVASASYEARAFGVRSGMPTSEAERLCPHAIFLAGNSSRYVHLSVRLYRLLERFSPRVEPASIDEAYLEVAPREDVRTFGHRIMGCIESELDLTASLGISDSKYLAKVCSSFAKPRGLTVLLRAEVATKLWPRPVDTLYGVGERTAERLRALGCESVGDVARTPVQVLKHAFGVYGETLHDLARGRDRWRVVTPREAADARSIGHRRTLSTDFHERSRIEPTLRLGGAPRGGDAARPAIPHDHARSCPARAGRQRRGDLCGGMFTSGRDPFLGARCAHGGHHTPASRPRPGGAPASLRVLGARRAHEPGRGFHPFEVWGARDRPGANLGIGTSVATGAAPRELPAAARDVR
jgi:nucleotidyltransferase/DNA polymerase involved in DNA repair